MADQHNARRQSLSEPDERTIQQTRQIIKEALEPLRTLAPDTFLGRETHPPFPKNEPDQLMR